MKAYKILSIDCWGNSKDGFEWNNWFKTGEYLPADLIDKPRSIGGRSAVHRKPNRPTHGRRKGPF